MSLKDEKKHFVHLTDLPPDIVWPDSVAVDVETMGLHPHRDRLCLVQLCIGSVGVCHLVQFHGVYNAPHLVSMLCNPNITKIFHFARFDLAVLKVYLGVDCTPIYCTKIASRLARTYTDRHGLKALCKDLLGVDISKHQQCSDWGATTLTDEQIKYAKQDVLYLHALKAYLDKLLEREDRKKFAQQCFTFLPTLVEMDLVGWSHEDIFDH